MGIINFDRKMMKKKNGFTLLELLVVIGIIALILGIAVASYSEAQKRSRDARRRSDLKAMQDALEQYYGANSYVYPIDGGSGDCSAASVNMKSSWPTDPGTSDYEEVCNTGTDYCICVDLEVDGAGNSGSSCAWVSGGDYYCVGSLQ
jgi:prepilin-type N-terminal cleavage/methylation domain-containing protein